MPIGILFWVIFVLAVLCCGGVAKFGWPNWSGSLVIMILLALLGWRVFGPVVQ